MADKKPAASPIAGALWILIPLTLVVYFFAQIYFSSDTTISTATTNQPTTPTGIIDIAGGAQSSFLAVAERIWNILVPISVFFSLVFGAIIIYCYARVHQIREKEKGIYEAVVHPIAKNEPSKAQLRWDRIVAQANSENEQDWKLAILDADIMLDELLDAQGYRGESIGEKLKQIERSDFNTIDFAWEAHKVRNKIAHEGSAHLLNAREARRVIGLFQEVFKEFRYIQ